MYIYNRYGSLTTAQIRDKNEATIDIYCYILIDNLPTKSLTSCNQGKI
jgi:hypothetical protein